MHHILRFQSTRYFTEKPGESGSVTDDKQKAADSANDTQAKTPDVPVLDDKQEQGVLKAINNRIKKIATKEVPALEDARQVLPTDLSVMVIRKNSAGKHELYLAERELNHGDKTVDNVNYVPEQTKKGKENPWSITRAFSTITSITPFTNASGKVDATTSTLDNLDVKKDDIIISYNMLSDNKYNQQKMAISYDTQNNLKKMAQDEGEPWFTQIFKNKALQTFIDKMFTGTDEFGQFLGGLFQMAKDYFSQPPEFTELPKNLKDPAQTYFSKKQEARIAFEQLKTLFATSNGNPAQPAASPASNQNAQPKEIGKTPEITASKKDMMDKKVGAKKEEEKKSYEDTRKKIDELLVKHYAAAGGDMLEAIRLTSEEISKNTSDPQLKFYFNTWVKRTNNPSIQLTNEEKKALDVVGVLSSETSEIQKLAQGITVTSQDTFEKSQYKNTAALTHHPYDIVIHRIKDSAEYIKTNSADGETMEFHAVINKKGELVLHQPAGAMVNGFTRKMATGAIQQTGEVFKDATMDAGVETAYSFWNIRGIYDKFQPKTRHSQAINNAENILNNPSNANIFKYLPAKNRHIVNGISYHLAMETPENAEAGKKQTAALAALETYFSRTSEQNTQVKPNRIMIGSLTQFIAPDFSKKPQGEEKQEKTKNKEQLEAEALALQNMSLF